MSNSPTNSGSGNLAGAAGPVGEETGYAPAQGPRGELIVVSAPSGAGKSSIIERVVSRSGRLVYSISYTTRPARGPEKDGVDYHFVSQEDFTAMRERGEFLEWARVHGHLYGTRLATVEMALAAGNDVILDIDVQGANQVRRRLERAVTVFVFPPSRAALVDRLSARNLNTPGDLAYRLENASSEVREFDQFNYVIVNDELERAARALESIILAERLRPYRQQRLALDIIRTFGGGGSDAQ